MVRTSNVTVKVPAAGPNNRTDVKTKVSDMEIVAATDGSLTVADPDKRVRSARMNQFQPMGRACSW
jgi:hypothetical protein